MRAKTFASAAMLAVLPALAASACDSDPHTIPMGQAGGAGGEATSPGGGENSAGGTDGEPGEAGSATAGTSGAPSTNGGAAGCAEGAAGDPPADYLAEFASGTRLEARYYAAAGMPDVFAGFYDTELDDWCDFMVASDDKLRCLPRGVKPLTIDGYAGATCAERVLVLPQACADASAVYLRQRLECLDKAGIFVATPYSGSVYRGSPGSCTSDGAAQARSYTHGAEVPATDFVEGTLVDLPGVCEGSLRVVEAADGARGPFEVFDVATGVGCEGGEGCRPRRRAFEEPALFTDDACEVAATESYATWNDAETCAPPEFVRPLMNDDVWFRAGPLSDAELYSGLGGCVPAREREWIGAIYEVGEPFALSELAPFAGQRLGTGRLRVGVTSEAGTPLMAGLGLDVTLYDSELEQDCHLRQLEDGSLRCIATTIIGGGLVDEYNDADCTIPLRRCVDDGSGCAGQVRWDDAVSDERCTSTPPTTGIWKLTEPATGYYRESPGFPCYAGGAVPEDAWQVTAVAPADLPGASLEVAP